MEWEFDCDQKVLPVPVKQCSVRGFMKHELHTWGGWWQTVQDYHKFQWAVTVYTLPRHELFAEIEGYVYMHAPFLEDPCFDLWLYLVLASNPNPNSNTNHTTDTGIVSSHSLLNIRLLLIMNMFLKLRVWGSWLSLSGACVVWNSLFCPPQLYS